MLDDVELFLQLCQKHGIIAESEIEEAIRTSCSTGELKLGHLSIIASLCDVIAQVLCSSSTIKLVDLTDCMLLPKGLTSILKAIRGGSSVSCLYLKGNNISGPLVEQLGDLLLQNSTLKILHVEWNSLGSKPESFIRFCDCLAKNHYLEELNLQYNQISFDCADSIATALKSNRTLRILDLSWNTLGITGGPRILKGVQQNRSLISLILKGNCVPSEIISSINERLAENHKRQILCKSPAIIKENIHPVQTSSDEDIQMSPIKSRFQKRKKKRDRSRTPLEEIRDSPLGNSENEQAEDNGLKTKKMSTSNSRLLSYDESNTADFNKKIGALHQILQERAENIDKLKTEIESKNTELKSIKTENGKLKTEIEELKEEKKNAVEEKAREVENIKKALAKTENNWKESYRELEETYQNTLKIRQEIDTKNRAYEKELKKASLEMQALKEKCTTIVQNYEDTISECKTEVHRAKRETQERENRFKIETNTLKESLKESSEALEKCQEQLQKLRNELRDSLENQAKLKVKADESDRFAVRTSRVEEALHKCKQEREKLEDELQEARKSVLKLQEELIEPQKRYKSLKLELQLEKEKNLSLKSEMQDERMRMKEQNDQIQKLLSQINGLYVQISEAQSNHAEALRGKDAEMEKLKNSVAQKTRELDEFKSEQVQRAHQLQTALSKCFGPL